MTTPDGPAATPHERPPELTPGTSRPPDDGTTARARVAPRDVPDAFMAMPAAAQLQPVLRELAALDAGEGRMPDAIPDALARELARRSYVIERALGAGGMAVVFRARDERHHRTVAVKVVRAGADQGAERFAREIEIVARVTHPYIVSLIESGEADGLRFFVMEYVEGESLRARLSREGRLPVADALRIAGEVADALGYAHRHGIVHRDVKPENILLQDGHAMVADFGIARLMSPPSPPGGVDSPESLTATGLIVGTARYMSPEQASGQRDVDGRSDVYALGCVLFEMLAGRPPFVGTTVEVLQQHLTAPPPALRGLRRGVPPGVTAALTRALAKLPAERFATPEEFAAALALPRHPARGALTRRAALLVTTLAVAAGVGAGARATGIAWSRPVLGAGERILVSDVVSPRSDSTLGAVVTQALLTDLSQSRAIHVVTLAEVRETLRRMRRDSVTRVDATLAREVAQREGIAAVIEGELQDVPGGGYQLLVRLALTDSNRVVLRARSSIDREAALLSGVESLADDLRARLGDGWLARRRLPPLEQVTTPSLDALRKYTQAMRALAIEGDERRAATLLEEAISLDTGFAMAYNELSVIVGNQYDRRSRRIDLRTRAYERRHRLTERERLWLVGSYHNQTGVAFDPDKALAAYETLALIEVGRARANALNSAALIFEQESEFSRAADYLSRAIATDSTGAYQYSNLVRVQLHLGRPADARVTAERMRKWAGNHQRFLEARSWIAFTTGQYDSVRTFMRELWDSRRADPQARSTAASQLYNVARILGQPREASRWAQEAAAAERERGNAAAALGWDVTRAQMLIELYGATAPTVDSLKMVFAQAPPTAFAVLDGAPSPELVLAVAYAQLGQRDRVRELVALWEQRQATRERTLPTDSRGDRFRHLSRGAIASAEGRTSDALVQFRAARRSRYCVICADVRLGDTFLALGERDSARVAYEHFVNTPFGRRDRFDPLLLPHALRRLGELYEDSDRAKAAHYYARFVTLWEHADPELQPQVREIRRRLARLAPDGR